MAESSEKRSHQFCFFLLYCFRVISPYGPNRWTDIRARPVLRPVTTAAYIKYAKVFNATMFGFWIITPSRVDPTRGWTRSIWTSICIYMYLTKPKTRFPFNGKHATHATQKCTLLATFIIGFWPWRCLRS